MKSLILTAVLITSTLLYGCASVGGGDGDEESEGRRQFEERRLMDPSLGHIPPSIRTRELAYAATLPTATSNAANKENVVQAYDSFKSVGPWNIGGRTRALALDVADADRMLAAGVSGGLWESTNAGNQWQLLTPPLELHNITSLVQDKRPGKSNIWYYGTGESYGNSARITGNGIWRSIDGAKTFKVLPSTVSTHTPSTHSFAYSWRMVMDPRAESETILDATTRNGIWRSENAGTTWQPVLPSDGYFADVAVTDSGVFYAALSAFTGYSNTTSTVYGIFRSADGITWVNISPPDLPKSLNRAVIGVIPHTNNIFVIAETPSVGTKGKFLLRSGTREEWHSLWKYEYVSGNGTGNGGRWENRSANIPLMGGRNGDYFSQGGYDMFIRISPFDTNVVWLGGTNLYRSTDAFRTANNVSWQGGYGLPNPNERFPSWPNHHPDNHELLFHPTNPAVVFSANDGGVMRTNNQLADTVTWTSLNNGYLTTQHYAVSMRQDSATNDVMGGMQDNGTWATTSNNATTPWFNRNGGDGSYSAFAEHGTALYVSSQQGVIRRLMLNTDGSVASKTRIDPIGPVPADYLFINPFAIDPNAERIMYLPAGQIIYRNTDLSTIPTGSDDTTDVNWDTLAGTRIANGQITSIAVSTVPAHIVYYGTSTGQVFCITDSHSNTPSVKALSPLPSNYINAITVDPRDAQRVLVTFSNYGVVSIYATSNGGETWTPVSGNLEENVGGSGNGPAVLWTDVVPYNENTDAYLAATSTGLYLTPELNGMSTVWTHIADETIGNVPIDIVVTRHLDKRILVGTHGRGVFSGSITSIPARPATPTLLSPPTMSRGVYPDTSVSWLPVPNAVSYAVELCENPDFTDSVITIAGITGTTASVTGLEAGPHTYYWRVIAFSGGGKGQPSEPWQFSTLIRPPLLNIPANRAENVQGLPVTLAWERVPGATSYDVQVAPNLAFTTIVFRATGVTDTTIGATNLTSNTRYFWRVRSTDPDTTGLWPSRSQFVTGVLTSVDEWETAQTLHLWPNPATDVLHLNIPDANNTSIEIVNAQGKSVLLLTDVTTMQSLSIKALSAGTYTVRVRSTTKLYQGQFTIVR